jgi:diguanylate cyclase (GGDEF)-like protein
MGSWMSRTPAGRRRPPRTPPRWRDRGARLRRSARLLRRPAGLVERTRWLFLMSALAALALTPIGVLIGAGGWSVGLVAVSCAGLAASWVHRYRRHRARPLLDGTDVLCVLLFTLACAQPAIAIGLVVPALWFRALYPGTVRLAVHAAALFAAMVLAVVLEGVVPGLPASAAVAPVLGTAPLVLITAVVARHLARSLFQRQREQEREAALARLGSALLGVTDQRQIMGLVWRTAEAVCRATPGLRVAVVREDGDRLRVLDQAGDFLGPLPALPRQLLPAARLTDEPARVDPTGELVQSAGIRGEWLTLPVPDSGGTHVLLGAAPWVPRQAVLAAQSMLGQLTLALRTSAAHHELQARAGTDGLTGLANRTAFSAAMAAALRDDRTETWVLFLDLDDFKVVNDDLGHLAGDQLLTHLGTELPGVLRSGDLCARVGGDEFAVLLHGTTEAGARAIGQRLVDLIATPVPLAEGMARIGASVGAAPVRPGSSESHVVHQADLAMYAAKAAGKNRVQVFHAGLLQLDDRAAAEAELRAAIEAGELVLAYQPVLSAADGHCTAVEALVRWQHPHQGLLGPSAFLGLAEETGAIIPLGEHVLRSACRDAAAWADASVAVHVNASSTQLAHPHFVDLVREALADAGLRADRLVVEVTETTVLDAPAVAATLEDLAHLGVGIALDDFGTGYAALTTLRSLPIDTVKIDRSFVAGALTRVADRAVVEAIVHLADRLGLATVAEGVESAEQQEFLVAAGITAVQGFLHLPPVPLAEFTVWLAQRQGAGDELTPA